MASGKLEIKNRIKTVGSIQKITKAMKLVASAKLAKQRSSMEKTKIYSTYLTEILGNIVAEVKNTQHPYLVQHEGKPLYLVITSDMGLCGGYNGNIYRFLNQLDNEGDLVVIGQRGIGWAKASKFHLMENYSNLGDDCYDELALLMKGILEKYTLKQYGSIHIVYTKFINSVTFEVAKMQLLPVETHAHSLATKEMLFEPSQKEILDYLVPMYINASVYSCFLEAKTSEHASRRTAMEAATDNASELQEKLELQYNQARQAAITQEISEIVGGAEAL